MFSTERDAKRNASTLGFIAQNGSVIHRADGMSLGIEAARGQPMDLGNFMWSAI
jgi:hypothetical protein